MMRTNASLHADQARWHVGKSRVHLATRPLLPQHDRPALIKANNVERVLTNIDAHYDDHGVQYLRHGVLLVFGAFCQLRSLAGQEHGRTIPLADIAKMSKLTQVRLIPHSRAARRSRLFLLIYMQKTDSVAALRYSPISFVG
jgi:hypothetical protein